MLFRVATFFPAGDHASGERFLRGGTAALATSDVQPAIMRRAAEADAKAPDPRARWNLLIVVRPSPALT